MARNINLKIWRGGPMDGKLEDVSVEANEGGGGDGGGGGGDGGYM